jgi:hypothetical protein
VSVLSSGVLRGTEQRARTHDPTVEPAPHPVRSVRGGSAELPTCAEVRFSCEPCARLSATEGPALGNVKRAEPATGVPDRERPTPPPP